MIDAKTWCERHGCYVDEKYGGEKSNLDAEFVMAIQDDARAVQETTMSDAKHTPTPYHLSPVSGQGGEETRDLMASDTHVVAEIIGGMPWSDESEATAEFILRACNSHDALLAACVTALAWVSKAEQVSPPWNTITYTLDGLQELQEQMRAAIAQAKGN